MADSNKNIYLILLLAFAVRFTGIWYGLPALYDPDEPFIVNNALSYGAKKSLEPSYFDYPTLYSYFLFAVYGGYYLSGKLAGSFHDATEFATNYFIDPTAFYFIARMLSVLWGVLAVWVVYLTGRRFLTLKVGLYAALLLSLSFLHVDKSHWGLLESPVTFLSALALYFIFRFSKSPTVRNALVAGFVAGLAVSTKYNAGFIFVPLLVAGVYAYKNNWAKLLQHTGWSVLALLGGFLLGSPYWLVEPSAFLQVFQWNYFQANYGVAGHYRVVPVVWPFFELMFVDWSVGVLMIVGFFYAIFQRRKEQILLLGFALPTLLFVGSWDRGDLHYIMPVYPAMVLLAAMFLDDIAAYVKSKAVWTTALAGVMVITLLKIVHYDIRLTQPDTRTLAQRWIERNIPQEAVIGYENYAYGPNLFDPARFVKYDNSEKQVLPLEIKERLLLQGRRRKRYQLMNFRKDFKPAALSRIEALVTGDDRFAQRKAYLQSFMPGLDSMQKKHVQYLIVSSYNYGRYFRQKPPDRDSPAWYAFRVAKLFYQGIFDSEKVKLLREFRPTFWNLGPVIKFYEIVENADHAGD